MSEKHSQKSHSEKRRPLSQSLSINNLHSRLSSIKKSTSSGNFNSFSLRSIKSNSSLSSVPSSSVPVSSVTTTTPRVTTTTSNVTTTTTNATTKSNITTTTSNISTTGTMSPARPKPVNKPTKERSKRFSMIYERKTPEKPIIFEDGPDLESNDDLYSKTSRESIKDSSPFTPLSDLLDSNSINVQSIELSPNTTICDYDMSIDSKKRISNFNVCEFINLIDFDTTNEPIIDESNYMAQFNNENDYVVKMVGSCLVFGYESSSHLEEEYFDDEEIELEELYDLM